MARRLNPVQPGQTFNMLTFIEYTDNNNGNWHGLFQCSCGEKIDVRIQAVKAELTKSCGCMKANNNRSRSKRDINEVKGMPVFKSDYLTDDMIGWVVSPCNFSLSNY